MFWLVMTLPSFLALRGLDPAGSGVLILVLNCGHGNFFLKHNLCSFLKPVSPKAAQFFYCFTSYMDIHGDALPKGNWPKALQSVIQIGNKKTRQSSGIQTQGLYHFILATAKTAANFYSEEWVKLNNSDGILQWFYFSTGILPVDAGMGSNLGSVWFWLMAFIWDIFDSKLLKCY